MGIPRDLNWALMAAWLIAFAGFVVMAAFASQHDTFPSDVWLTHRLQDIDNAAFGDVLDAAEVLIRVPFVVATTLVVAALFLYLAGPAQALLVVSTLVGRGASEALKEIIARPRPSPSVVRVDHPLSDPSFPSGHADSAMLLFGLAIYVAAVYVQNRTIRTAVQAVSLLVIVGNALQRVYVGDHWPSDVAGGLYMGLLLLAILIAIDRVAVPWARERNFPLLRSLLGKPTDELA